MTKHKELWREHWRAGVLLAFLFANIAVWSAVYELKPGPLRVAFLDVGQGDAIFIETPTHKHLLLDGGPDKSVMTELGQLLPFGTKRIDVVMESHPDKDHIGGLPEVLERYEVGAFIEPGVESENSIDDVLHERVAARGIPDLLARRGMIVNFGDGVRLTVLFPNQDVSRWETNAASIVAKLTYGETSFLLTGDSPTKVENILLTLNPYILKSDVLKAGHHGSRTSTAATYATAVAPEYAVISAGADNSYGHPNQEVLDILKKVGAQILSTEDVASLSGQGTIIFESDGKSLKLK